jgi:hypothetical protein
MKAVTQVEFGERQPASREMETGKIDIGRARNELQQETD